MWISSQEKNTNICLIEKKSTKSGNPSRYHLKYMSYVPTINNSCSVVYNLLPRSLHPSEMVLLSKFLCAGLAYWFQAHQPTPTLLNLLISKYTEQSTESPKPRISPTSPMTTTTNGILTEILMILSKRCTWGPMKSKTKYWKTESLLWPLIQAYI